MEKETKVINTAVLFLAFMVKFPDQKFEECVKLWDELPQDEKDEVRQAFEEVDSLVQYDGTVN